MKWLKHYLWDIQPKHQKIAMAIMAIAWAYIAIEGWFVLLTGN